MKKMCVILGLCLALSGCASVETFETLGPVEHEPGAVAAMGSVQLELPESAAAETFSDGSSTLYVCDGYSLMLQIMDAGDFERTAKALSGFDVEKLTVMESKTGTVRRYDWVWTAAGEGGDVLCRATVLDDGNYHYCLCTMAPATDAGKLQQTWNQLFRSFSVSAL